MTEVRHEKINFTPVLDPEFTDYYSNDYILIIY